MKQLTLEQANALIHETLFSVPEDAPYKGIIYTDETITPHRSIAAVVPREAVTTFSLSKLGLKRTIKSIDGAAVSVADLFKEKYPQGTILVTFNKGGVCNSILKLILRPDLASGFKVFQA